MKYVVRYFTEGNSITAPADCGDSKNDIAFVAGPKTNTEGSSGTGRKSARTRAGTEEHQRPVETL